MFHVTIDISRVASEFVNPVFLVCCFVYFYQIKVSILNEDLNLNCYLKDLLKSKQSICFGKDQTFSNFFGFLELIS